MMESVGPVTIFAMETQAVMKHLAAKEVHAEWHLRNQAYHVMNHIAVRIHIEKTQTQVAVTMNHTVV